MRRFKLHSVAAAILTFALGLVLTIDLSNLSPHFWGKLKTAKVTYNGQLSDGSTVYRSIDGDLLVALDERISDGGYYEVLTKAQAVGTVGSAHLYFIPGYVYCRINPPPVSLLTHVKHTKYADLVLKQNYAEFNSASGARISVSW